MQFYSPEARAGAEGDFYGSTGNGTVPDLGNVGYGDAGTAAAKKSRSFYASDLARRKSSNAATLEALTPTTMAEQKLSGGNKWLAPTISTAMSILNSVLASKFGGK
jgi:hypothetical protein